MCGGNFQTTFDDLLQGHEFTFLRHDQLLLGVVYIWTSAGMGDGKEALMGDILYSVEIHMLLQCLCIILILLYVL